MITPWNKKNTRIITGPIKAYFITNWIMFYKVLAIMWYINLLVENDILWTHTHTIVFWRVLQLQHCGYTRVVGCPNELRLMDWGWASTRIPITCSKLLILTPSLSGFFCNYCFSLHLKLIHLKSWDAFRFKFFLILQLMFKSIHLP